MIIKLFIDRNQESLLATIQGVYVSNEGTNFPQNEWGMLNVSIDVHDHSFDVKDVDKLYFSKNDIGERVKVKIIGGVLNSLGETKTLTFKSYQEY